MILQLIVYALLIAALLYLHRRVKALEKGSANAKGGKPEPTTADLIRASRDAHEARFHKSGR